MGYLVLLHFIFTVSEFRQFCYRSVLASAKSTANWTLASIFCSKAMISSVVIHFAQQVILNVGMGSFFPFVISFCPDIIRHQTSSVP
jgi:hypothetical protein